MMYKFCKADPISGRTDCVKKITPDFVYFIPIGAEDNTDYQEYLAWLAEGNEPLPAE